MMETRDRKPAYKKRILESMIQYEQRAVQTAAPTLALSWFVPNLRLLRVTGFWSYSPVGAPLVLAWAQAIYMHMIVSCNVIFFVTKAMHTVLEDFSIRAVTENLVELLCITFSLTQLLVLLNVKEKMLDLTRKTEGVLCRLYTEADEDTRKGLLESQAWSHKASYVIFFLFLFTGSNFALIVSLTGNKKHALPIPIWTPFPQNESPTLEFLLLIESMGVVLTVAGAGALAAFFSSFVRALQAAFRVGEQTPCADRSWSESEKCAAFKNMKRNIQTHQIVLDLSHEVCLALEPFFACQLSTIAFMICIALFQVSVDPSDFRNIRFIVLLVNVVSQSFTICLQGTNLSEEARAVQDGFSSGNWYFQGKDLGIALKFIAMRAQKPPRIMVAKCFWVQLPTFVEMMRTSYSFFAFLQKRAGKEQ